MARGRLDELVGDTRKQRGLRAPVDELVVELSSAVAEACASGALRDFSSCASLALRAEAETTMVAQGVVRDEALRRKLTPDYTIGCKTSILWLGSNV